MHTIGLNLKWFEHKVHTNDLNTMERSCLPEGVAAPCEVAAADDKGGSVVAAHAQPHHEQVAQLTRLVNVANE